MRGLIIRERSPAPVLAPEVQAVVTLEDLTKQSVFLQPIERRSGFALNQPAVVAEVGIIAIQNPALSGAVVVVDGLFLQSPNSEMRIGFGSVTGLAPVVATLDWFDNRLTGLPVATFQQGTNIPPQLVNWLTEHRPVSGHTEQVLPGKLIVVNPGQNLLVECLVVNVAIRVAFTWIEYTSS